MAEIADLTYNMTAFPEIMGIIWKRVSDTGKNWRHVYKSLVLLDYLVKTGAERVQNQCKENIYSIQTLKDFQYVDRLELNRGSFQPRLILTTVNSNHGSFKPCFF